MARLQPFLLTNLQSFYFEIRQSTFTNNNTFSLNYSFHLINSVFILSGTNSFISNYLKYFGVVNSDETTKEKQNQKSDGICLACCVSARPGVANKASTEIMITIIRRFFV